MTAQLKTLSPEIELPKGIQSIRPLPDDALGQLLSGTLMDYALPYATDVPPVDGFYQEVRATTNPSPPLLPRPQSTATLCSSRSP